MDVHLLGTGSADGWPNPYCHCDSCEWARDTGNIRTPTSVLIDEKVWIDPGPEAPRQAVRFGLSLASVRLVLVSHVHTDHLDPGFLLHRSWVSDSDLLVVGPEPVSAECAEWLAPDQTSVILKTVTAGESFTFEDYRIEVLASTHEALGETVLYRVENDERSLLYACDTGPWADGVLEQLAGRRLDLVLLEQTFGERTDLSRGRHHDLVSFRQAIADLRDHGVIDDATQIAAVHLSHHNTDKCLTLLALDGSEVPSDGTIFTV